MKTKRVILDVAMYLCLLAVIQLATACNPCKTLGTVTTRYVRDTLVVSNGVQIDTVFTPGDTVRIDTGRLHIRLFPLPLGGPRGGPSYTLTAACLPDTIRVPKIVREYTTLTIAREKKGFWHYSGQVLLALVVVALIIFIISKSK